MNEVRDLIIGIDFSEKYSQLAYYDRKQQDTQSVSEKNGSDAYEIETVLCARTDNYGYSIGLEARYFAKEKGGILLDQLYEQSDSDQSVQVGNCMVKPARLLAEYFMGLLKLLGVSDVIRNTRCLVITAKELTAERVRNLSEACQEMGLLREQFLLMDYGQSFFYYAMTTRRENWNRNVGWYHFQDREVVFKRLRVTNEQMPVLIRLEQTASCMLPEDLTQWDTVFTTMIKETLSDDLYSTVFLTGNGFSPDWAVRGVKVLCQQQRKVSFGNNLFVKGACLGGKENRENHSLRSCRFMGEAMVQMNIGMDLRIGGAASYYPLIEAGKNWYEYHPACEIILDSEEELAFFVWPDNETERQKVIMKLEGLPARPPRTTRLHIEMEFTGKEECMICVRDMGFGEMFPSSGLTWTEHMKIEGEKVAL